MNFFEMEEISFWRRCTLQYSAEKAASKRHKDGGKKSFLGGEIMFAFLGNQWG